MTEVNLVKNKATSDNPQYNAKIYMNDKYLEYHKELRKYPPKDRALTLYSFRVYLASINEWKIINRHRLRPDELIVMERLGIYKLPRKHFY